MKDVSVYVHIPYCLSKCPYCDFNSYAVSSIPEKDYVGALLAEIDFRASRPEWRNSLVKSIYFGGGTPSLFSPASIEKIIGVICKSLPVDDAAEISLEGNPCSLSADKLSALAEVGVNRISLGAQSHNQSLLARLGRIHTPAQIDAAVSAVRAAGIANLNLDLIYGIPGQNVTDLEDDLTALCALSPDHFSAYGLTLEKGTPFFAGAKKGEFPLLEEEAVLDMMKTVNSLLLLNGFERYEISNFSKPGKAARHNLAYWKRQDYLGIGAGAHSLCKEPQNNRWGRRWSNLALPSKYMQQVTAKGDAECWRETLGVADAIFEFFFLGLRRIAGVSLGEFRQTFGVTVDQLFPALLEVLVSEKLLFRSGDQLALTEQGLLVADSVIENFSNPEVDPDKLITFPARPSADGPAAGTAGSLVVNK